MVTSRVKVPAHSQLELCVGHFHRELMLEHFGSAYGECFLLVLGLDGEEGDIGWRGSSVDALGVDLLCHSSDRGCIRLLARCELYGSYASDSGASASTCCKLAKSRLDLMDLEFADFFQGARGEDLAEIFTSIGFDDDQIAFLEHKVLRIVNVEEIGTSSFEFDDVQRL